MWISSLLTVARAAPALNRTSRSPNHDGSSVCNEDTLMGEAERVNCGFGSANRKSHVDLKGGRTSERLNVARPASAGWFVVFGKVTFYSHMSTIKSFEEIEAWKGARELTRQVYALARRQPVARDFGMKDQICRAAVSVMSNIAEGYESQTEAVFIRHLGIAKGSARRVKVPTLCRLGSGLRNKDRVLGSS